MDGMDDVLKHLKQFLVGDDGGTWVNVAKLSSEDILKKKNHDMQLRRLTSEGKVLYSKLEVIRATMAANSTEFWDGIYKAYNLPSDLTYKIDADGQVLKHVPSPDSKENP